MSLEFIALICSFYSIVIFAIAFYFERRASKSRYSWSSSPFIYTLSLTVYCTAWTFYGAVGSAARNGLEFVAIYIGPTIALMSWWWLLKRLVDIKRTYNITSIADILSSRYGKSNSVAVIVTLICVVAIIPYVSLQLQSIAQSFTVFIPETITQARQSMIALTAAIGLGVFSVMFGTRSYRGSEKQEGLVMAIAFESLIKLLAISAVGIFVLVSFSGPTEILNSPAAKELLERPVFTGRWFTLVSVSFMAIIVLPRMFHVMIVENQKDSQLSFASWAFPLYLLLLNIFVLPIALAGMELFGTAKNPDNFLISIPLFLNAEWLALLAFIGGFSAATSMIIMSTISISVMVTNHIATPLWLDARGNKKEGIDVKRGLLATRRFAIILVMLLGYLYFEIAGNSASLASIGLIAFVGVVQIFPSLFAALFWKAANRYGASSSMLAGTAVWLYCLYIPSVSQASSEIGQAALISGLFGIEWLSPNALFGSQFSDPLTHAVFWSLFFNISTLIVVSLITPSRGLENLLANQFVNVNASGSFSPPLRRSHNVSFDEFYFLTTRIFGKDETERLFKELALEQGVNTGVPIINDDFIEKVEKRYAGILGGASAHALIAQLTGKSEVPVEEIIKFADEAVHNVEYAKVLREQSRQIERTAKELQKANESLIALDSQKDVFLSQISHEVRTPLTSIKSLTEILRDDQKISEEERMRLLDIICSENDRLTSLLDEILDLSHLESGQTKLKFDDYEFQNIISHAIRVSEGIWLSGNLDIVTEMRMEPYLVHCDFDRISQVCINLITNAVKYAKVSRAKLTIRVYEEENWIKADFRDNGPGISKEMRDRIFEPFERDTDRDIAGSAGLGLAISQEIARSHGGTLKLIDSKNGALFCLSLPKTERN